MDETLKFLRDEPAKDDRFGSHGRISQAIAHVLELQPEVRLIGILGQWGSGKTTVVKALERLFTGTADN